MPKILVATTALGVVGAMGAVSAFGALGAMCCVMRCLFRRRLIA
jgi:hypothetical protein